MDTEILLLAFCALALVTIILLILFRPRRHNEEPAIGQKIDGLTASLQKLETGFKDDFRINREENAAIARDNRAELNNTLKAFREEMGNTLQSITDQNRQALEQVNKTLEEKITALIDRLEANNVASRETLTRSLREFSLDQGRVFDELKQQHRERFEAMEQKQQKLMDQTEKKLEQMRETVDEKLQKTLNERLSQSFETVGKQLQSVQEGLGEMRTLAQDVGGLKKVLSNVKMRGGIGEVQLQMLLEQILAPEQYEANVKTRAGSSELVEFAIRLPGREQGQGQVWLPIDAKFPKEVYEQLQNAYDIGDLLQVDAAQKNLELAIKKMARDISDKYLDPPHTTDFGIMFLPFEGIYAEVVRKASLLEDLQRNYKIVVTGPSTLAAILNSLQMGFRTLAIQQRSSEVWQVLGAVKKEFETFGGMLQKAQNNIQTGLNQLDDVMGKRTRAIQRKLRTVESLEEGEAKLILPEAANEEGAEDEYEN